MFNLIISIKQIPNGKWKENCYIISNINRDALIIDPGSSENIIQGIDNVAEVTVYGEKNMITGNIVCANIRLISDEDNKLFISRLKKSCRRLLQSFQVPVKVKIVAKEQYSERYKKIRIKHD